MVNVSTFLLLLLLIDCLSISLLYTFRYFSESLEFYRFCLLSLLDYYSLSYPEGWLLAREIFNYKWLAGTFGSWWWWLLKYKLQFYYFLSGLYSAVEIMRLPLNDRLRFNWLIQFPFNLLLIFVTGCWINVWFGIEHVFIRRGFDELKLHVVCGTIVVLLIIALEVVVVVWWREEHCSAE